jgi:hypothetical protein
MSVVQRIIFGSSVFYSWNTVKHDYHETTTWNALFSPEKSMWSCEICKRKRSVAVSKTGWLICLTLYHVTLFASLQLTDTIPLPQISEYYQHPSLSMIWVRSVHLPFSQIVFLRFRLMLSSHLLLSLPRCGFPSSFLTKLHACPSFCLYQSYMPNPLWSHIHFIFLTIPCD